MPQFIRDNLLSSVRIHHDGEIPTADKTVSPTSERLMVLGWFRSTAPSPSGPSC